MLSITYEPNWEGPLLPEIFSRMLAMAPNSLRDCEITIMRNPENCRPQTIVADIPDQRLQVIIALPQGRWDSNVAAHEFKHLLQVIAGEHSLHTPKELEDQANAFETSWGNHWSEPAPKVGCSPRN